MKLVVVFSLATLLGIWTKAVGQSVGSLRIIDAETKQPLPDIFVFNLDQNRGTISNEEGRFDISFQNGKAKILLSMVGYKRDTVNVSTQDSLLLLVPAPVILSELVINGNDPLTMIDKAVTNFSTNETAKGFHCFYRQTTRNDDKYSELLEAFYDVNMKNSGIEFWELKQGRYAVRDDWKKAKLLFNQNFSVFTKRLSLLAGEDRSYLSPFSHDAKKFFNFKMTSIKSVAEGYQFEINFEPLPGNEKPGFEGTLVLNENCELLRFTAKIVDSRFLPVDLPSSSVRNLVFSVNIHSNEFGDFYPTSTQVDLKYDYQFEKNNWRKIHSKSTLVALNKISPLATSMSSNVENDFSEINALTYNNEFWEKQEILKLTKIEKKLVDQFNRNKDFKKKFQYE